jgi:aryl-alcohol dehydrogenase-like predicted oxidoreductase
MPDMRYRQLGDSQLEVSEVSLGSWLTYWGFSEWTAEQIESAVTIAHDEGLEKPVSSQPQYTLLWRRIESNRVLAVCEENGISQIVWSPLAQGVLTGKYQPGEPPPEGTRAASEEIGGFISGFFRDDVLEAIDDALGDAARLGEEPA